MKTGTAPCRPGRRMSTMRPLNCAHLPPPEEWRDCHCTRFPTTSPSTSSCPLKATPIFGRCA